ncbi:homogentisate phytyltransferase 1, chloroplastic isoform X5 [Citrus sinensis]|uniref:homogentisate phytyltransferase 1, chloroplastic isoform X5 n=1 Tax=Citrus sinensis TaxID=2711 RepID=UPI00227857B5|nr:homogentisate phytyltransferase 1, chloroplastic isoform X5 [Citrus sinensis]
MESLLVGFSPSSALVSSGSSCWRNKDLMAGHFPILQITGFYKGLQVSRCKVWNIIDRTTVVKLERYHLKHHIRGAKDRSIYHQKIKIKHLANAASGHPLQSNQPDDYKPKSPLNSVINALDAFYRFSRPHTVIGTALSIVSVALLAVEKVSDISPLFFTGVLEAIAAALMMNIYIVGLNQLSDIEIDKVNKPYLPLASGEYSFKTGVLIVASFSIMSFWLGWIVGSWPLFWALFTSFVLGTAYSINLPLLRWKRFAVAAAMCILAVRAVVVQLAFYLHMQTHVYRRPAVFSKPLIFATAFMSFFSVVIALFKDVPDLEGDKTFGIRTFTVRLGQKRVLGHSILALILWNRAKSVDIGSKTAITSCYMFIWKLFYAEYLLIPFVR